jgi:hypothetical protein
MQSFESKGQNVEVNNNGIKMEKDNVISTKKCCILAMIIGSIFVIMDITDKSFSFSLGELTINCSLIGVAIIIIALLVIGFIKPKVKIN